MNILVIDIGGTNVKIWKSEEAEKTKFPSGKDLTPQNLMEGVREALKDWQIERISIGYPGEIRNGHPIVDPINLAGGWVGFDFAGAFGCPVRLMNDASMQALGSYEGGKMFYLGLGTGVGTTFIMDGTIVPLALGHLKLWENETFDYYLSREGLKRHGKKRWRQAVSDAAKMIKSAFFADYIVIGGGNADEVKELPPDCRRGGNHNAYFGGLRMWEDVTEVKTVPLAVVSAMESESA
ncbi:MAG: ROK family protein [Planctomycetes bacterium]|nr:ROK family protein [Planctomycetota bacterium]